MNQPSKYQVFIDGESGTTGLQIRQRLLHHPNIEVVSIAADKRKDEAEKVRIMQNVDVCILCLPDDAARQSAILTKKANCRVLDASSAHRVSEGWTYGLPELDENQRESIKNAARVSNPGCHATGANLLLKPLSDAGLIDNTQLVQIISHTGYTGGGKQMISRYEQGQDNEYPPSIEAYSLGKRHKHVPEIQKWANLGTEPILIPCVGTFPQGMLVQILLDNQKANTSSEKIKQLFQQRYASEELIELCSFPSNAKLNPEGMNGQTKLEIYITGYNEDDSATLLAAKFDNLAKGASGAAVQNLNIMLNLPENIAIDI